MQTKSSADATTNTVASAGQSGAGGATGNQPAAPPAFVLPDWLRPLTVLRFAPSRPFVVDLVAGAPTPILTANPMRVGLVLYVPTPVLNVVTVSIVGAPDNHVVWSISGGDTQTAMIADYFSIVQSGLIATASADLTLSGVEFARPC